MFSKDSQNAGPLTLVGQLSYGDIRSATGKLGVATVEELPRLKAPPETPTQDKSRQSQNDGNPATPKKHNKGLLSTGIGLGLALLIAGGYQWFQYATAYQSTDDAYTTGHMHAISSRINDTVQQVLVDDNQHVKAGETLVLLDPRDFQVKVAQAIAALKTAQNQADAAHLTIGVTGTTASGKTTEAAGGVSNASSAIQKAVAAVNEAKSAIPQAQAELGQKQAEEQRAAADFRRYEVLAEQGAVSIQQRDQAMRDYRVANQASVAAQEGVKQAVSRLQQAQDTVSTAKAQLVQSQGLLEQAKATQMQTQVDTSQFAVAQSAIAQAQAQLDDAQLQLSYTKVVSPINGRVGKKTVEEGQRVQPGQELMEVVSDDVWVVANFKETQLENMRPKQPVNVKIDAYPHHTFSGTVDSLSPGSGASFALLPPDNATGNFTKIVQRVPLKVVLDKQSIKGYEQVIVPGMSAIVTVKVGH